MLPLTSLGKTVLASSSLWWFAGDHQHSLANRPIIPILCHHVAFPYVSISSYSLLLIKDTNHVERKAHTVLAGPQLN